MLSRSSEYAVRSLALLATIQAAESVHSGDIAAELGLPPQFLTKILRRLAEAGVLSSQRGRAGGFRLERPAASVSLLEVVAPFEEQATGVTCLLGQAFCSDSDACPLHAEWVDIQRRFFDLLERTTLADVAERASRRPFEPILAEEERP